MSLAGWRGPFTVRSKASWDLLTSVNRMTSDTTENITVATSLASGGNYHP